MNKYRIKKGDTLEGIAEYLGLTYAELRDFHNSHCELYELLGDKIPPSLKEILYQTKEEAIRQGFSDFNDKTSFDLVLSSDAKKRSYGVQVSYFEEEKESNLKYTVHIQWLQRNLVRIHREKLFIDKQEASGMADGLATKLSAVLYPVVFVVNSTGELTGIYNHQEIKARWTQSKQKLKEYYTGELEEKYMALSEETLSNADLLFSKLKKDCFLQAFFNGLYTSYQLKEQQQSQRSFPILPAVKAVGYRITSQIESLEEEQEKLIKITLEGEVSDERSLNNFENEMGFAFQEFEEEAMLPAKGKYRALYFLEPPYYTMDSFYLECTLELEKNKKIYITSSQLKETQEIENNH